MEQLRVFLVSASLLLGACGPNVEEPPESPIALAELFQRIEAGSSPLVLDVRTAEEYARGHIPGATNLPYDELPTRLEEISIEKSAEVIVHCQSGRRAEIAEGTLRANGYSNVRDLTGHWQGWQAAGYPTE